MKKWLKRTLALACLLALALTLVPGASAAEERTIKDVQAEIKAKEEHIESLKAQIEQNEDNREQAEAYFIEFQQAYDAVVVLIAEQEALIASTEQRLEKRTQDLSDTIESIKQNEAYYTERLQAIYTMNGSSALLDMLLGAGSFSDTVRIGDALQRISRRDTSLIEDLVEVKERYARQKADLEADIENLNTELDQLQQNRQNNADSMQQMKNAIAGYNYQITLTEEEVEATEAEKDALIAELAEMFRRLQYKGSQAGDDSIRYDGPLLWPVDGHYRISSWYGDPRSNTRSHYGIDIPAGTGTPIRASASGIVLEATWHYSYGYYIVLDHGQGLRTLYAHCSELWVGEGQHVTVGDNIAGVGNTGNSYGAHLHFEVHEHGGRQNPIGSGYLTM